MLNEHDNTLLLLKSMFNSGAGVNLNGVEGKDGENPSSNLLDALQTMVENLRKECYATFAPRDDFDKMKK